MKRGILFFMLFSIAIASAWANLPQDMIYLSGTNVDCTTQLVQFLRTNNVDIQTVKSDWCAIKHGGTIFALQPRIDAGDGALDRIVVQMVFNVKTGSDISKLNDIVQRMNRDLNSGQFFLTSDGHSFIFQTAITFQGELRLSLLLAVCDFMSSSFNLAMNAYNLGLYLQ